MTKKELTQKIKTGTKKIYIKLEKKAKKIIINTYIKI